MTNPHNDDGEQYEPRKAPVIGVQAVAVFEPFLECSTWHFPVEINGGDDADDCEGDHDRTHFITRRLQNPSRAKFFIAALASFLVLNGRLSVLVPV